MTGRNPFRTEAEAYRFLLLTVVAFAAIAAASLLGGWKAGVPVLVVVTAAAAYIYLRPQEEGPPPRQASRPSSPGERRILVVANETVVGRRLFDEIRRAVTDRRGRVLVVSPALNSPIRHFVSDEDGARVAARERLGRSLAALEQAGIEALGEVGDADPLQAIEDALRTFGADEIIISTHPEGRSNWLERGVVSQARERFEAPVTHVVVDLEAEARAG